MSDSRIELSKLFAPLKTRLEVLKKGDFHNSINRPFNISFIETELYALVPENVMPYIGALITEVEEIELSVDNNFQRITINKAKQRPFNPFPKVEVLKSRRKISKDKMEVLEMNYYKAEAQKDIDAIKAELSNYKFELQNIISKTQDDLFAFGTHIKTDRLQFNLSLEQLAGLLRLFKEQDIIPENTPNVKIKDFVLQSLATNKGTVTSTKDILNNLSPDVKVLNFWKEEFQKLIDKSDKLINEKLDKSKKR